MATPGSFTYDQGSKALIASNNDNILLDNTSQWFMRSGIQQVSSLIASGRGEIVIKDLHSMVFPNGTLYIKASGMGKITLDVPQCQLNKLTLELAGMGRCTVNCGIGTLKVDAAGTSWCQIIQNPANLVVNTMASGATLIIKGTTMPHFTIKQKKPKAKVEKKKAKAVGLKKKKKEKKKKLVGKKVVKQGEILVQYF